MPAKEDKKLKITDTILRDAHQSLLATRMRTQDMAPILEKLDKVGYWSVECWGGATFDSCMRYLGESPWDRVRTIKQHMPNTKLQMLLRGQNIVGYKHYPDDVVVAFVERAAEVGIDVFRVFDALNDTRNMRVAIETVKKCGKIAEGSLSYTTSPVHNTKLYVEVARQLEDLGCDTLCIKDMAGLLSPQMSSRLVKALRKAVSIPIHLHCHTTSGMAEMAYLKGVEAGAQILDTAIGALAGGTSQPPTETIAAVFKDTPYDTGFDMDLLTEISAYFKEVRRKYAQFESEHTGVSASVLQYQIPGGMMSNLASQLRGFDALDRMQEVLDEVPKVRKELGYPPLVTPTSQIVGTQAAFNVITGKRYGTVPKETRDLVMGLYGRSAAPISRKVRKIVIGAEEPITCRPADLLEPGLDQARRECGREDIEDVLCYALFPQVADKYFEQRAGAAAAETADTGAGLTDEEVAALATVIASHRPAAARPAQQEASRAWAKVGRLETLRVFRKLF
jgi:pyruvate/oxaloacetate carboxyltransferase